MRNGFTEAHTGQASAIAWDGPNRQPCPDCARGPKDRSCGVTVEHDGSGVAHCFRCGYVEVCRNDDVYRRLGTQVARAPLQQRHESLSEFGRDVWAACGALTGVGLAYLEARSCVIPPSDGHLRYHPDLKHPPTGSAGAALVALVTDAITGRPLTLHRTWICADGTKAPLDPPRMLLGGHRKAGGVVRLWPDEAVTLGLGIAEGVETALSLAHAFTPVWACIDAGNMSTLPALGGIESLLIAADYDQAGIDAAQACAARWTAFGCDVRIVLPDAHKTDLNDMVMAE